MPMQCCRWFVHLAAQIEEVRLGLGRSRMGVCRLRKHRRAFGLETCPENYASGCYQEVDKPSVCQYGTTQIGVQRTCQQKIVRSA